MIEQFVNYIADKNEEYIIFDVGSRDCMQSIEFYHTFPNSKIYAFECNPNTLNICKKNNGELISIDTNPTSYVNKYKKWLA